MNIIKYASAVVALIIAISGGLWAFDHTYLRCAMFQSHEVQHLERDLMTNQDGIWQYEDRLKKVPDDEAAQKRLRQLEFQRKQIEKQIEQKRGG